ncbi:MAG TPA: hypothetical protein PLT91_03655 [Clostridia bacterium]|jgi:hypothetical protein|nr:MAG: hypothetical protein BWX97_00764 [Firmicutes bacterium ADurb.Bin146]HOD93852.1 hypothetical protein [Clostridia bacterium]HQM39317.1 hypothetical protein [Clostridia bacterium]
MLKNITLSAEEKHIEEARKKAKLNNTTLNEVFRHWLSSYSRDKNLSGKLELFLSKTNYVTSGRGFTKDELNER